MLLDGDGRALDLPVTARAIRLVATPGNRRWCEADGAFKGGNSRRNLGGELLGLSAAAAGQGRVR